MTTYIQEDSLSEDHQITTVWKVENKQELYIAKCH